MSADETIRPKLTFESYMEEKKGYPVGFPKPEEIQTAFPGHIILDGSEDEALTFKGKLDKIKEDPITLLLLYRYKKGSRSENNRNLWERIDMVNKIDSASSGIAFRHKFHLTVFWKDNKIDFAKQSKEDPSIITQIQKMIHSGSECDQCFHCSRMNMRFTTPTCEGCSRRVCYKCLKKLKESGHLKCPGCDTPYAVGN